MLKARMTEGAPAPFLFSYARLASTQAPSAKGGRAVADKLVAEHHYLCRRGARKFWRSGLERSDLEQVAALGLIKASRRFDESSATPFEAYAWIFVVGELMHHVRDHERPVRVPRKLQALERKYFHAHEALVGRLGREPSDAELACELRIATGTVVELRHARDAAVPAELDRPARSTLSSPDQLSLEDRLIVENAFGALDQVARRIIVGVYLLGLTQLQLARHLGLSPKRVSRLHSAALANMQRAWAS